MDSETVSKIKSTFDEWNKTQAYLKKVELITEAAPIAAINELRYAGRVFASAALMARDLPDVFELQSNISGKGKTFLESITITNQYINNANHDVSDTLVYFYNAALNSLSERYGRTSLEKKFPSITEAYSRVEEAKTLIVESRGNISIREKNYRRVKSIMEEMSTIYPSIRDADILQEIASARQNQKKKALAGFMFGCGIIVGGIITAYWM